MSLAIRFYWQTLIWIKINENNYEQSLLLLYKLTHKI
jgi:hypothetical protein